LAPITAVKPVTPLSDMRLFFAPAFWALDAVFPQTRFQILAGGFFVGIQLEELESAYCAAAH